MTKKFFEDRIKWLVLMASSMWLDGMTTAYNLTHGRAESNPLLKLWFDGRPWGFPISAAITGLVIYLLMKKWDDKTYRYALWIILASHMASSWMLNIIKVGW